MPANKKNKKSSDMQQVLAALRALALPSTSRTSGRKVRKSKRKRGSSNPTVDGEITMSRSEMVATIYLEADQTKASGYLDLDPTNFSFLKTVGKAFNRSRWTNVRIYYKPAVGTTWGGLVSMGVNLDSDQSIVVTRAVVVAMTPSCTNAAWMDTESKPLTLNGSQLRTRDWYFHNDTSLKNVDRGPGVLYWALDGTSSKSKTTVGEIWIHYSITMQGTEAS